ncbi:hypothetical protein [Frondihabitans australicus]|uniref:WXG100 family type VII secretion target n=1 Tax=Frondihabitans australicus TaxID=386892 RepID=A0A495IM95_9MICO|nr:hypothetical protein [Frondihabitans australicus]RKR76286.1 hypothetical protein C8E83_3453 [Frondihabitans australicus]
MAGVIADPKDLRNVRSALDRCQKDIDRALAQVRGTLRSANWRDDRRVKFEKDLESLLGSIARFSKDADELKTYLGRKADELDRFLSN